MTKTTIHTGIGPEAAQCGTCELQGICHRNHVQGEHPDDWKPGGLMIIGDGPGTMEVSHKRPFVGPSGRLLDALLENAGIDRADCWVTNATMGMPPRFEDPGQAKKGTLHERFPMALYSCLPRLLEEIARAQPRVILTLGQPALIALAGVEENKQRLVPNACPDVHCDPATRKYRTPCFVCANGKCNWLVRLEGDDPDAQVAQLKLLHGGKCPLCLQSISRLRAKSIKCLTCGGKKKKAEDFVTFNSGASLVGREGVAGAVYRTEDLPSRLDEYGVRFVIPSYHPSYCLRPAKDAGKYIAGQYAARAATDHYAKAKALLTREPVFTAHAKLTQDANEVRAWFGDGPEDFACDIETNSMDGPWGCTKITCIGFARASSPEALVIDTRHLGDWAQGDPLLDEIHRVLVERRYGKVFHHGSYDRLVILRLWGIEVEGVVGDTLLEHHALYPDEEQGLGFVAHELLDAPAWKGGSHKIEKGATDDLSGYDDMSSLAEYNARDTRATILCDEIMRGPRGSGGRMLIERVEDAHTLDLKMQSIGVRMEAAGLPVSRERFNEIASACRKVMDAAVWEMGAILNMPDFNPRGEKLAWALFDPAGPLRLPVTERTASGAPSASKEVLARMSDKHPFIAHLLMWRKYEYVLSHYVLGDGLAPGADGRVHPQWKIHGTVTGRWSSSPNFQNWPKGTEADPYTNLRSAIVAPPGRVIVGADYSQLEMRIMASLSGDDDLMRRCMTADENDKLNPERDPHSYVAAMAFGRTFLEGTKAQRKALRDVAKRIVYGLNYGAGAATILAAIYDGGYSGPPITVRMVESVIAAYFRAFPGVPRWRDNQLKVVHATQEVRSPIIGRRRIFPLGEIDATVAYNYPIQSGAADVMSMRLAVLDGRLRDVDPSAEFIAQVHDAIYIECDENKVEKVEACVEEALRITRALVAGSQPMDYVASASHARSWDKAA